MHLFIVSSNGSTEGTGDALSLGIVAKRFNGRCKTNRGRAIEPVVNVYVDEDEDEEPNDKGVLVVVVVVVVVAAVGFVAAGLANGGDGGLLG